MPLEKVEIITLKVSKKPLEVLDKLYVYIGDFEYVQSFDLSFLCTTFPHNLIKKKIYSSDRLNEHFF